ncbi:hypothetical protein DICPUDRAFT_146905 [Dictyostelium purpureum]|uniref:Uncharacterized protein n=1 Tax=Dictyostelium purpureum TaxID=5786 RepID=F0Z770_DICPU|nr:uncharacterized protein DICPUDRAFT_146905 [Dictyostelium purpureum]EGC40207.1 hypothetical protein DICPUDRAFT_146905 [Dictyostelium purpureum]|eukprot:XP_003283276.1 hypothetical protein DICPUDRAFT_146905 [Dictyostelium purpureum]
MNTLNSSEQLFWSVFKNKYLVNLIFSFLKNRHEPYLSVSYSQIIDITYMINNGRKELLKDKVKSNQFLVFGERPTSFNIWNQIFCFIGEDYQFYRYLFKNYSKRIYNLENIAIAAINSKTITPILVLIKDKQYTPSFQILKESIKFQFFKSIKFLLKNYKLFSNNNTNNNNNDNNINIIESNNDQNMSIDNTLIYSLLNNCMDNNSNNNNDCSIVHIFFSNLNKNKSLSSTTNKNNYKIYKIINWLINKLNFSKLGKNEVIEKTSLFYQCPFDFKLKHLVEAYRLIVCLELSECKNVSILQPEEFNKSLSTFTKQELNTSIDLMASVDNQIIKELVTVYLSVRKQVTISPRYLIVYNSGCDFNALCKIKKLSRFSLQYANFDIWKLYTENINEEENEISRFEDSVMKNYISKQNEEFIENPSYLFKYVSCIEKKKEYIKSMFRYIHSCFDRSLYLRTLNPMFFFNLILIATDSLELIEFAYNELNFHKIISSKLSYRMSNRKYNPIKYVRSTKSLEYILDQCNLFSEFESSCCFQFWISNGRGDLLELYLNKRPNFVMTFTELTSAINNIHLSVIKKIIENKKRSIFDSHIIQCLHDTRVKGTLDQVTFIIDNTSFFCAPYKFKFLSSADRVRLFNWILKERENLIGKRIIIQKRELKEMQYLTGDINKFLNLDISKHLFDFDLSFNSIAEKYDKKIILKILNDTTPSFNNNNNNNNNNNYDNENNKLILGLLSNLAKRGWLSIFKSIYKKQPNLLLENRIFSEKDLVNNLLIPCVLHDHYELCEFMINTLNYRMNINNYIFLTNKNSSVYFNLIKDLESLN